MSRSATLATRNEATKHLKPPKMTTSAELTWTYHRHSHLAIARTVADGCGRLRTVGQRRANTPSTPRPPEWNGNACYAFGKHTGGQGKMNNNNIVRDHIELSSQVVILKTTKDVVTLMWINYLLGWPSKGDVTQTWHLSGLSHLEVVGVSEELVLFYPGMAFLAVLV